MHELVANPRFWEKKELEIRNEELNSSSSCAKIHGPLASLEGFCKEIELFRKLQDETSMLLLDVIDITTPGEIWSFLRYIE